MIKMNTLVVDDDKLWQQSISKFVQINPNLHFIGTCSSAMEAYGVMAEKEIDLLICDIEMPEMSGIDFVRNIKNPPLVDLFHRTMTASGTMAITVTHKQRICQRR